MKKYKNSYCVSLVVFVIYFAIVFLFCTIPFSIVFPFLIELNFFQVIGLCLFCIIFLILLFSIIALLMNFLIRIFTEYKVYLSEEQIIFNNKTFELSQIQYATIYLPNFSRYHSEPLQLVLWTYDKQQMIIKRPNILMTLRLKKLCNNTKFEINELWKEIKFYVLIGLFTGLLIILLAIFSPK